MTDGTVLLTGASGLLGTWLRRTAPPGVDLVSISHQRPIDGSAVAADLRDPNAVAIALRRVAPDLVIHAAFARDEASIVQATRNLAECARDVGAEFVFVSSDAIFSGDGSPRSETAAPDPVWDYGRWKAEAEAIATELHPTVAIVRLPLIISLDPEDHLIGQIRAGIERGEPAVWFTDEMRQPAEAAELAGAIWRIVARSRDDRSGVWHLPGPERLSRDEIARRVAAASGFDPASVAGAPTPPDARRPRDIFMTADRAVEQIDWSPSPIHPRAHG